MQTFNRYHYVMNNPFRYTDPTGYGWWSKIRNKAIGAAIMVVGAYVAIGLDQPQLGTSIMSYGAYYAGWSNSAEVTIASGSYGSSSGGSTSINISTIGGNFDYSSGSGLSYNGYSGGSGSNFYGRVGLGGAPRVDIGGNSNVRYAGFDSGRPFASGAIDPLPLEAFFGPVGLAKAGLGVVAAGVKTGVGRNIDSLGSLLNASKFEKFVHGKYMDMQFESAGSARNTYERLKNNLNVSESEIISYNKTGAVKFVRGNQTFMLRPKSKPTIQINNEKQSIVIRFPEW